MMSAWEQFGIPAFVAAFVSGLFLVGGYYYNKQLERSREEGQTWQRMGIPLIAAADDVIARVFDIIVRNRPIDLNKPLERKPSEIFNPPKELSTIWRLMYFFAATNYLERHVADEKVDSRVSNLRYYANHRSRLPLKGNIHRATFPLQTEGQFLIGSKILGLSKTHEIREVDFFQFVKSLELDDELYESAEAVRKLLNFRVNGGGLDGQLLSIAHFCIYLIDLVQDLRPTSKWEEFRLYLAVLLRAHNRATAGSAVFLYRRGDLGEDNYLDTFNVLPSDEPRWYHLGKSRFARRNKRICDRAETGFPRTLSSEGVLRVQGDKQVTVQWKDNPGDVKNLLVAIF